MRIKIMLSFLLLAVLAACGPKGPSDATPTDATVVITSHSDGQTVSGAPGITVTAELSDSETDATVSASLNGADVPANRIDDTISISVTLREGDNTVSFTVANAGQSSPGSDSITLHYEPTAAATVEFTSHSAGDVITGSRTVTFTAELTAAAADADIAAELNGTAVPHTRSDNVVELQLELQDNANTVSISVENPYQTAGAHTASIDVTYPFMRFETGQEAALVIGQDDFISTGETAGSKVISSPYGRPVIHDGVLYVPDWISSRVMGYMGIPAGNGASADFVLGQPDFDSNVTPVSGSVFYGAQTLATDGTRLFVTDFGANRVLIYDSIPKASAAGATWVVGQTNLMGDAAGCTASQLINPESLTVGRGKLIVADSGANRVLVWNQIPASNAQPADIVIGQRDMINCALNDDPDVAGPTARTLHRPSDVWSDGARLVVSDSGNNRVLIWNEFPDTPFAEADVVIGQDDFTSGASASTATTLFYPYMIHSNGNQLFVADSNNNRVLIWNEFPTENGQAADVVLGQVDFVSRAPGVDSDRLDFPTAVYVHGNQLFVGDNHNGRVLIFEGQ